MGLVPKEAQWDYDQLLFPSRLSSPPRTSPACPVPRLTPAKSALAPGPGRNGKTALGLLWGLGGKWSRQLPEESDGGRQECPLSGNTVLPAWMPESPRAALPDSC